MSSIALGAPVIPLASWLDLAHGRTRIKVSTDARARVRASRRTVEQAIRTGATIYGVNTGFGKLASIAVPSTQLEQLQHNLIVSHATGLGEPLSVPVSRLALALRIQALLRGCSGVRLELVEALVALFNADLIPVIPSLGSVGASGDLAPLAHMAMPLLGLGKVHVAGKVVPAAKALSRAGLQPIRLAAKEGLALINGTQIMTAIGLLTLARAQDLAKVADIACATTIEALEASARPADARVHEVRPHPGQRTTAANLRSLLANSAILSSHANCAKVQDAYSMRCAPQVHGASKDGIGFAAGVLAIESCAVTDNPLIFADGEVISAGNFHGQPVSQAMDYLSIALATLANISERRIENMVNPDISGLPPFLADTPGLESGYMIAQVVAAALASENKTLAHPKSVDTIPTSANREDHVSMGVTAAHHATMVADRVGKVLAIELMVATKALELGSGLRPGRGIDAAYRCIRKHVRRPKGDHFVAPVITAIESLITDGELLAVVQRQCGDLAI